MEDIREKIYHERLNDAALNYAWEARNAEEHDASGSADTVDGPISLTAIDGYKPIIINDLNVVEGNIVYADIINGIAKVEDGILVARPVVGPGGKRIIEPPDLSVQQICTVAMNFSKKYYKEIFK